jgi:imidazole glycerol phosphate synthase subunit HisF
MKFLYWENVRMSGLTPLEDVEAALAAGIFHREEVPIEDVKDHMREKGIETR